MDIIIIFNKEFKAYYQNRNYYVSRDGEVYSLFAKRLLKQYLKGKPEKQYYYIDMYIDGKQKHIAVHRMVFETWIRRLLPEEQINHINDNQLDNRIENLYAGSQKDNIYDSIKNEHRVGNIYYLTLFDNEKKECLTFCPASDFLKYCGHSCKSGCLNKVFKRQWFKSRYQIIEYKRIKNNNELYRKGVTTNPDECRDVGLSLSQLEERCVKTKR